MVKHIALIYLTGLILQMLHAIHTWCIRQYLMLNGVTLAANALASG